MANTTITGNLGKAPELKHTQQGKPMTRLSVAWSERQRDRNGEYFDGPTVWVSATVFGRQAEHACGTFSKGDRVIITGDLKPEVWNSDQGEQTVFAMMVQQVGVSMIGQEAQVNRVSAQNNGGGYASNGASGGTQGDPWNSQPRSETGGFGGGGSEPPF